MNKDEIILSIENLKDRRLRSFLSILSILIGIAAIFAIASFGLGLTNYVDSLAEEAGTDKFYIQTKGTGLIGDETFYLTEDDIDFVSKENEVREVAGMYAKAGEIEYKDQKKYSLVIGLDPEKKEFIDEVFALDVERGRHLKEGDLRKVFLGYNYLLENKIFKESLKVGDKVTINSLEFEIVGFYEEVGNPQDDSQMYLIPEAFESLYPKSEGRYAFVMGSAEKGINMDSFADNLEDDLRKFKGQEEGKEDFFVLTFEDALETFGSILTIINGSLLLIALISIFVATVNIMNTMYTAVIERTKEIGVMKAVGAKNNDILFIFVFESGFLGMFGGILGVGLGYLISSAGGQIAASAGYALLAPIFPWYLTLGCIMFGFLVGAGAGILPARQASGLAPVDALRYE
ncbi:FtsX-like permease family protein [Candidatus Woesearchaeota archaeon]|nr:FtsX-like permease family protein [Candidatus Woesearchaeota archaeon]